MKFSLRPYKPSDFEVLWAIDQQCFPPEIAYTRRELAAYMKGRGAFTIVAQADPLKTSTLNSDDILGFLVAQASPSHSGHLVTIDVIATARRFGVGSKLLAAAERDLAARGCKTVELETAVNNHIASPFYEKHGYTVKRTIANYYANGIDALVMSKEVAKIALTSS